MSYVQPDTELVEYESIIERGLQGYREVGKALEHIRERRLYRRSQLQPNGFDTFYDYCRDRWKMTETRANQLIQAAQIADRIETTTIVTVSETETHLRPLRRLDHDAQASAWELAVATAPDGKVTERHVAGVVDVIKRQPETLPSALDTEAIRAAVACREVAAGLAALSTRLLAIDGEYLAVVLDDDLFQSYEHCFMRFVEQRQRLMARRADPAVRRLAHAREGTA